MPASLPGESLTTNTTGNPSAGQGVIFDMLSGPKGSPFDKDTAGNASTGGLSTGIGFGPNVTLSIQNSGFAGYVPPLGARIATNAGFFQNEVPGQTTPGGTSGNGSILYIGGGRMVTQSPVLKGRPFMPSPYINNFMIAAAGNGQVRDQGAGPAFTGAKMNMTFNNTGPIPNGTAIVAPLVNRSGTTLPLTGSCFAIDTTVVGAPS